MFKSIILAVLFTLGLLVTPLPAQAEPSDTQPATLKISRGDARTVARYVVKTNLVTPLDKEGRKFTTKPCNGGPYLWKCPAKFSNTETKCNVVTWIWAKNNSFFYYEWHKLSCRST